MPPADALHLRGAAEQPFVWVLGRSDWDFDKLDPQGLDDTAGFPVGQLTTIAS